VKSELLDTDVLLRHRRGSARSQFSTQSSFLDDSGAIKSIPAILWTVMTVRTYSRCATLGSKPHSGRPPEADDQRKTNASWIPQGVQGVR